MLLAQDQQNLWFVVLAMVSLIVSALPSTFAKKESSIHNLHHNHSHNLSHNLSQSQSPFVRLALRDVVVRGTSKFVLELEVGISG